MSELIYFGPNAIQCKKEKQNVFIKINCLKMKHFIEIFYFYALKTLIKAKIYAS